MPVRSTLPPADAEALAAARALAARSRREPGLHGVELTDAVEQAGDLMRVRGIKDRTYDQLHEIVERACERLAAGCTTSADIARMFDAPVLSPRMVRDLATNPAIDDERLYELAQHVTFNVGHPGWLLELTGRPRWAGLLARAFGSRSFPAAETLARWAALPPVARAAAEELAMTWWRPADLGFLDAAEATAG